MYNPTGEYVPLREEQFLGDPSQGDVEQGVGYSTSQLQNPNISLSSSAKVSTGPPGLGFGTWAFIVALLILCKVVAERAGNPEEFRSVRVGLENFWVVGTMSALFIFALKMVAYLLRWNPLSQFASFL